MATKPTPVRLTDAQLEGAKLCARYLTGLHGRRVTAADVIRQALDEFLNRELWSKQLAAKHGKA